MSHIVLVEDDPELLAIETGLLRNAGYRVTALSQVNSLDALPELGADCFILDEQIPVISGHIICIYLRSKAETKRVPVILVSAHPSIGNYAGLCNADAFLAKPFDIDHFIMTVGSVLRRDNN